MPAPTPPSNVTATKDGHGGVNLAWTRTAPGSFNVYRDTSSTGDFALQVDFGIGDSPFTDITTVSGLTYYYVVTTVLNSIESNNSNVAGPVTP